MNLTVSGSGQQLLQLHLRHDASPKQTGDGTMASSLHMDQLCHNGQDVLPISGNNTVSEMKDGVMQEALFHTFRSKPPEKQMQCVSHKLNKTNKHTTLVGRFAAIKAESITACKRKAKGKL